MNVQPFTALRQRRVHRVDRKHTAAAIEVGDIARLQMIPGGIAHSFGQQRVEYQAARRGKHKTTLRRVQSTQAACDASKVRSLATKSLRAKVVGHTSPGYEGYSCRERTRQRTRINITDTDGETVARKSAAGQFARVRVGFEDTEVRLTDFPPGLECQSRARDGVPLNSDGAPILQACIAHIAGMTATELRQFPCNPLSVGVVFADLQQYMLAAARRSKAEVLLDDEVFGLRAQCAAGERLAMGARWIESRGDRSRSNITQTGS